MQRLLHAQTQHQYTQGFQISFWIQYNTCHQQVYSGEHVVVYNVLFCLKDLPCQPAFVLTRQMSMDNRHGTSCAQAQGKPASSGRTDV